MIGNGLADHLPILLAGLGLLPDHMLVFMSPHGGGHLLGGDVGGGFKGHAGIVGAVLVGALLTGLALALLHDLLGALGLDGGGVRRLLGIGALEAGQLGGLGLVRTGCLGGGALPGGAVPRIPDAHTHRHLHRVGALPDVQGELAGLHLAAAHRLGGGDRLDGGIGLCGPAGGPHRGGALDGLGLIRALGLGGAAGVGRTIDAVGGPGAHGGNTVYHKITSWMEMGQNLPSSL